MSNKKRHAGVTTIGVLNLIVGGLSLLMGLCCGAGVMLVGMAMSAPGNENNPDAETLRVLLTGLDRNIPGIAIHGVIFGISWIVTSTMLVVSGFGMFARKKWAWWMCLLAVLLNLLTQAGSCAYTVVVENPKMPKMQREFVEYAKTLPVEKRPALLVEAKDEDVIGMHIQAGCMGIVFSSYSILLLIILPLSGFRAAFGSKSGPDDNSYRTSSPDDGDFYYYNRESGSERN